jgi:hypothetical protein
MNLIQWKYSKFRSFEWYIKLCRLVLFHDLASDNKSFQLFSNEQRVWYSAVHHSVSTHKHTVYLPRALYSGQWSLINRDLQSRWYLHSNGSMTLHNIVNGQLVGVRDCINADDLCQAFVQSSFLVYPCPLVGLMTTTLVWTFISNLSLSNRGWYRLKSTFHNESYRLELLSNRGWYRLKSTFHNESYRFVWDFTHLIRTSTVLNKPTISFSR